MCSIYVEVENGTPPPPVPDPRADILQCEDTLGLTILGFEIRCQCGSNNISVDEDKGEVTLTCRICKRTDAIHRDY